MWCEMNSDLLYFVMLCFIMHTAGTFRRKARTFSVIVIPIGVIVVVTATVLLVAGSVLSTQNG